jgi:hypothetical protein
MINSIFETLSIMLGVVVALFGNSTKKWYRLLILFFAIVAISLSWYRNHQADEASKSQSELHDALLQRANATQSTLITTQTTLNATQVSLRALVVLLNHPGAHPTQQIGISEQRGSSTGKSTAVSATVADYSTAPLKVASMSIARAVIGYCATRAAQDPGTDPATYMQQTDTEVQQRYFVNLALVIGRLRARALTSDDTDDYSLNNAPHDCRNMQQMASSVLVMSQKL